MTKRHPGMDLLRILSAMMIVALHFCGYSENLLIATASSRGLFVSANIIEALCICGVNIFVMVACYNNIHSAHTEINNGIKRLSKLWVQTIMVTIPLGVVLFTFFARDASIISVLQSIIPITTRGYWFITAFAGLCLLFPLLNRVSANASNSTLAAIAGVLLLVYSAIPTFCELFGFVEVQHGYSLVWFVTIYFCIAVYVRFEKKIALPKFIGFVGYISMSAVIAGSVVMLERILRGGNFTGNENYIIRNYASIPVALQAFCLFFACAGIRFRSHTFKAFLVFLANGSLLSYLLHMHPILKEIYLKYSIADYFPVSSVLFIISCVCASCVVPLFGALLYKVIERPVAVISTKISEVIWNCLIKAGKKTEAGVSCIK